LNSSVLAANSLSDSACTALSSALICSTALDMLRINRSLRVPNILLSKVPIIAIHSGLFEKQAIIAYFMRVWNYQQLPVKKFWHFTRTIPWCLAAGFKTESCFLIYI